MYTQVYRRFDFNHQDSSKPYFARQQEGVGLCGNEKIVTIRYNVSGLSMAILYVREHSRHTDFSRRRIRT